MADAQSLIAHLLRRTGFGPRPGQVEALTPAGYGAALDGVLAAAPRTPSKPLPTKDDDYDKLIDWWLDLLNDPNAGLHEKMVWFWHGHLTSSIDKSGVALMARQHETLRKYALGNARQLFQAITIDGAMLSWLDGDGSESEGPNENYSRELMELFALGVGNYTEDDVKHGAYALSGWVIDDERDSRVGFHSEAGPQKSVSYLGTTVSSAREVVDAVCSHDKFALHLAGRLYRFFHGVPPTPAVHEELAAVMRRANLEIAPLVEAILRHPTFTEHRMNRPRLPVEWLVAADAVLDVRPSDNRRYLLESMGQVPFDPPNVAGWPIAPRWLSAASVMSRTAYAWEHSRDTEVVSVADPVGWVLARASLFEVSAATKAALDKAARSIEGRRDLATLLHALVVSSPDFALC